MKKIYQFTLLKLYHTCVHGLICCRGKGSLSEQVFQFGLFFLMLFCWMLNACRSSLRQDLLTATSPPATKNNVVAIDTPILLHAEENSPPQRIYHQLVYDQKRRVVILFGGQTEFAGSLTHDEQLVYFNDTWEFEGETWHEVKTPVAPAGRVGHGMAYDTNRGVVVLYGGDTLLDSEGTSTWEYDAINWYLVTTDTLTPGRRGFPLMVFDPDEHVVVLSGGLTLDDAWKYDGQVWSHLPSNIPPAMRASLHAQVFYDDQRRKFIFTDSLGETLAVNLLQDEQWQTLPSRAESDGTRQGFRLAYDRKRNLAVLFGGVRYARSEGSLEAEWAEVLNDTWEYDGEKWYEIKPSQSPPPRYLHAMAYDEARGVIVLFGGADADNNALNDTWEYDGITWVQR